MSDKLVHLAVDAGQSSIRLRAGGAAERCESTSAPLDGACPLPQQWAAAITAFLHEHPDLGVHTVAVGSSALGRETAHDLLPLLDAGVRRVVLAPYAVTSYLGALGDGEGCVIAAGTGAICLAVGPREVARVDGWGPVLGDAGSAYWIGRTAMEAALRGHDGRRQMTALTGALAAVFPSVEDAHLDLQRAPDRVTRIAAFAATVDELAASDRVAGNILDKAAAHLSEAVQAAIRRASLSGPNPPRVAATGGVFRSERVLRRFTDYLTLQWPTFALWEPAGDDIDGAEALVDLQPAHPLYRHLSVAER